MPKTHKVIYKHESREKQSIFMGIVQVGVIALLLALLPPQNVYSLLSQTEKYEPKEMLKPPTPAPYPVDMLRLSLPELTAGGVVIIDIPSRVTLYEKNPDLRFFPASTTKIMTALIVLDSYSLDDVVSVNTVISEGQVMGLIKGEQITVENLLYGILVHSANDAAYALAEHYPGGIVAFVAQMNKKANQLHLDNTHFTNPIGFDEEGHYTTPRDLARLSLIGHQNSTLRKVASLTQITVSDIAFLHFHPLKNVNELIGKIPGVSGLKTGWTAMAGQSLVTTAKQNDREILIIILKSEDRFGETEKILQWVFTNFDWRTFQFSP